MLEKIIEKIQSLDSSDMKLPKVEILSEKDIDKISKRKNKVEKLCYYCGKHMNNFKEIFIWHNTKKDFLPGRYCSYLHAKAFIIECLDDNLFEDYVQCKIDLIKADYLNDRQIDILNERTKGAKRRYRRTRATYQDDDDQQQSQRQV